MSTRTLISVEEYLSSSYEPDVDYVDGNLEERNLGERTHAKLQGKLAAYLLLKYEPLGLEVLPEVRVQVSSTRFRIPDIAVTWADRGEEILSQPPLLCIEILSPEDRLGRMRTRVEDYLRMGVPTVWVLDPYSKQAYVATQTEAFRAITENVLRTPDGAIELPLDQVF